MRVVDASLCVRVLLRVDCLRCCMLCFRADMLLLSARCIITHVYYFIIV